MSERHLRQQGFTSNSACGIKRKKKRKKKEKNKKRLRKQDIQNICIYQNMKTNKINFAFNVISLKDILRIYLEEQPMIKYNVGEYLILAKTAKYGGYHRGLVSVVYYTFR